MWRGVRGCCNSGAWKLHFGLGKIRKLITCMRVGDGEVLDYF